MRNLSLGERMKCELAAGLLHRPQVLFLDEPTIGLDITAQVRIRDFLHEYNRRTGATILLTSHYMADVTALCERIIIIHQGQLKYDGGLADLSRRIAPFKLIGVALGEPCPCDLTPYGTPVDLHKARMKTAPSSMSRCRPTRSPRSPPACWPTCPSTT